MLHLTIFLALDFPGNVPVKVQEMRQNILETCSKMLGGLCSIVNIVKHYQEPHNVKSLILILSFMPRSWIY